MPQVWARVLGTGFGGLAPSLLLQTEHGCILFNAAEGMQRFCAANKVKFGKLHSVFLTDLAPGAFGGLPGLLLSASDMGIKKLNICGPDRVLDLLRSSHTFVRRETLFEVLLQTLETVMGLSCLGSCAFKSLRYEFCSKLRW